MNMLKIVATKDCNLLAQLNEEIQTYHYAIQPKVFKPYNKEAIINFFETTLNNENAMAYVAKDDDTAIGYILLFKINVDANPFQYSRSYILIDQILVLKNHRGKGVGKLLLDTTYAFAKESNIVIIELNHWTQNDTARTFFIKNKFEYYNEKMWKEIK
jgi:GNAT superfamily N-acetyltransferase